ncbi:hypothetical protein [Zoogloea sp.]|uniref:hypothetical protein n=1 Tax=Zoogloea sp. TaxID=49181 RepID=UPI0035B20727
MNSKTRSALRSTLEKENASLAARLPEPGAEGAGAAAEPAPVTVAPAAELVAAPVAVETPVAVDATLVVEVPAKAEVVKTKPARAVAKPAVAKQDKPAPKAPVKARKPAVKAPAKPAADAPAPELAEAATATAPVVAKKTEKTAKQPKPVKVEKLAKPAKPAKAKAEKAAKVVREKVVRDSFSMPKSEHAQLKALRETLAKAGRICTKSELLRAGVQLLLKESSASAKALVEGLVVVPKGKSAK